MAEIRDIRDSEYEFASILDLTLISAANLHKFAQQAASELAAVENVEFVVDRTSWLDEDHTLALMFRLSNVVLVNLCGRLEQSEAPTFFDVIGTMFPRLNRLELDALIIMDSKGISHLFNRLPVVELVLHLEVDSDGTDPAPSVPDQGLLQPLPSLQYLDVYDASHEACTMLARWMLANGRWPSVSTILNWTSNLGQDTSYHTAFFSMMGASLKNLSLRTGCHHLKDINPSQVSGLSNLVELEYFAVCNVVDRHIYERGYSWVPLVISRLNSSKLRQITISFADPDEHVTFRDKHGYEHLDGLLQEPRFRSLVVLKLELYKTFDWPEDPTELTKTARTLLPHTFARGVQVLFTVRDDVQVDLDEDSDEEMDVDG